MDRETGAPRSRSEAMWRWVELLDAVERGQAQAHTDDPQAQRRVGHALDALAQYEHTLLPLQRRQARAWVWLRDRRVPLPPEEVQRAWEVCRCRYCLVERVLGRPSVQRLLSQPVLQLPSAAQAS